MKEECLKWCLEHRHWTIEDWKKVVWTDETPAQLNAMRGKTRVTCTAEERYNDENMDNKWAKYSEFQFWGAFSWYERGPCHIYQTETAQQKKEAQEVIDQINQNEAPAREKQWDGVQALLELSRNRKPRKGCKPQFKPIHLARKKDVKGIDWYLYQSKVLTPKLLPFAKHIKETYGDVLVQEDGAGAHAAKEQGPVWNTWQLGQHRLHWCGNSPDLNVIEIAWSYLKQHIKPTSNRKELEERWLEAWENLSIERIRGWIETIQERIEKVIELKGNNNYKH